MGERMFVTGNDAIGWGALDAGCDAFFGYPVTPQNEIIEWFAREFPKRDRVFLQASSETSSINMVYGGASSGFRVMTSTAGPGWGLMQETLSHLVAASLPCVVSLVQRGGPGQGTTRHAQMDYLSATRGGGQGGYKNICLAPASVQDNYDLAQLAFHLADKYRNPVIILTESVINQTAEPLERNILEFGPPPTDDWGLKGKAHHQDGKRRFISCGPIVEGEAPMDYLLILRRLNEKYQAMAGAEVRYEAIQVDDADLLLVAYGYAARVCMEVVAKAREAGLRVGLIRPITLWPFPSDMIKQQALRGAKFLVVEDNLGQMLDDVKMAVEGKSEIQFLGALDRHQSFERGLIFPTRVLEEVRRLL